MNTLAGSVAGKDDEDMTVRELIVALQREDPNREVEGYWDSYEWPIRAVARINDKVLIDVSSSTWDLPLKATEHSTKD